MNRFARAAALACLPLASHAADIVLTPPAGGGVAITNAAGGTTRLRVADDGLVTLPSLTALPVAGTGLCIDAATGRIGTCTLAGGTGTVTSLVARDPAGAALRTLTLAVIRNVPPFGRIGVVYVPATTAAVMSAVPRR